MSKQPEPKCPHCMAATHLDRKTVERGVKDQWSLKCNQCGKESPADEWLRTESEPRE